MYEAYCNRSKVRRVEDYLQMKKKEKVDFSSLKHIAKVWQQLVQIYDSRPIDLKKSMMKIHLKNYDSRPNDLKKTCRNCMS